MESSQSNQLLFLRSSDGRDEGNGTYNFHLNNPLQARRGNRIMCELAEAEIPCSFYNFTNENNFLKFETFVIFNGSTNYNIDVSFTIPEKNYTISELQDLVNNKTDRRTFGNGEEYELRLEYDPQTLKIEFKILFGGYTGNPNNKIDAPFKIHQDSTAAGILGLSFNDSCVVADSEQTARFIGTKAINLHRTMNVYVRTNLQLTNVDAKGEMSGILAKVQVDKPFGEIVHYHNIEKIRFLIADKFVDNIQIVLETDDGRALDFNGLDFHLTLAFFYVKEQLQTYVETLHDKIKALESHIPNDDEIPIGD